MADREFLLKIVADVTDAVKGIGKVDTATQETGMTAGKVAKTVASAISATAIIAAGKAVVNSASEQEQAIGAANSVFKEYGSDIQDFAKTTASSMGISRGEFSQSAAVMGSLLKAQQVPLKETVKMTEDLTGRAADLSAMYGGTVPEAMAAMQSALKGEFDPLEALGVSLKASTVDAKAQAMGFVDAKGKATAYGKAMATTALIMEQSADSAGQFGRESGSLAGQTAIMQAQFKDLQASLGQALLPVIVKFGEILRPIIQFIVDHQDVMVPIILGITGLVAAIAIANVVIGSWTVITGIATGVTWAFGAAIAFLTSPIGLIILAVAALAAGFIYLYTQVDWFRNAVDATISWIADHWKLLLAIIVGPIAAAVYLVVTYWDQILDAVKAVWNWISDNWKMLLAIILAPFAGAVWLIINYRDQIWNAIKAVWQWITDNWRMLLDILLYPFKQGVELIKWELEQVKTFISNLPGYIRTAFNGLADIIKWPFKLAFDAIKSLWNSTVGGFGFSVPSWVPGIGGKGFNIPRMAKGGIVTKPTIALIGEAGPEAVVPLNGSTGMGTVTFNIYALTASAEVGRQVYAALQEYERISGRKIA
jgi:hypothetical protein